MAWSEAFLAALEAPSRRVRIALQRRDVYDEPGVDITLYSDDISSVASLVLDAQSLRVSGQQLRPRGWTTTIGAFGVDIVTGNGAAAELVAHWTRGTVVALLVGFDDMPPAQFQQVAVGQVWNLRRATGARWTLEVRDLYAALAQRLTTTAEEIALFNDVTAETTLSADYATGDTTLNVSSSSGFVKGSKNGALLVTPTSGDPFLLEWSAKGAGTFTVVAGDLMGTTRVAAVAGDTVSEVVYLYGHPLDIVREVLCSTGNGTNGAYDVHAEMWGLAVPDSLLDHDDIDRTRDDLVVVSSGSYLWQLWEGPAPSVPDAYAWLTTWMAGGGFFLAVRQGVLTVRAAQLTNSVSDHPTVLSDLWITDNDIVSVESYEMWEAGHAVEYQRLVVTVSGSVDLEGASSELATLPGEHTLTVDLSDRVYTNGLAHQQDVYFRLVEDAQRIPERLVLRCTLRLAQACIGDVITLDTVACPSRALGDDGFVHRPALVDMVEPDWLGGTCRIGLLVYPTTEEEFGS